MSVFSGTPVSPSVFFYVCDFRFQTQVLRLCRDDRGQRPGSDRQIEGRRRSGQSCCQGDGTVREAGNQQGKRWVAVQFKTPPASRDVCNNTKLMKTNLCCVQVEPGLSPETSQVKFIPRDAGPYQVELTYDGVPIPGSPFSPTAYPASDPSKVSPTQQHISVLFPSVISPGLLPPLLRCVALDQGWSVPGLGRRGSSSWTAPTPALPS